MQVWRVCQGGYWRASKRWCKTLPEALVNKALISFTSNGPWARPPRPGACRRRGQRPRARLGDCACTRLDALPAPLRAQRTGSSPGTCTAGPTAPWRSCTACWSGLTSSGPSASTARPFSCCMKATPQVRWRGEIRGEGVGGSARFRLTGRSRSAQSPSRGTHASQQHGVGPLHRASCDGPARLSLLRESLPACTQPQPPCLRPLTWQMPRAPRCECGW